MSTLNEMFDSKKKKNSFFNLGSEFWLFEPEKNIRLLLPAPRV